MKVVNLEELQAESRRRHGAVFSVKQRPKKLKKAKLRFDQKKLSDFFNQKIK